MITLYGRSFSKLKDYPLLDDPYVAKNRDMMYIGSDDTAHCLLLIDYDDSGDGILVESESMSYVPQGISFGRSSPNSYQMQEH